jgi:hypothetical protein
VAFVEADEFVVADGFADAVCDQPSGSLMYGGFALAALVCARTELKSDLSAIIGDVGAPRAVAEIVAGSAAALFDGTALVATDATRMHQGLPGSPVARVGPHIGRPFFRIGSEDLEERERSTHGMFCRLGKHCRATTALIHAKP